MPLELIPYKNEYYEEWLDLVALSSVEVDEDIYIYNEKPSNLNNTQHFLFSLNQEFIASFQLSSIDESQNIIKHWSIRGSNLKDHLLVVLKLINERLNKSLLIWSCSKEAQLILDPASKNGLINEKVSFYSNGSNLQDMQQYGFCDHIYGECQPDSFQKVNELLPIVNKDLMKPRYWKCFEISLN
ncbi:MAG: hypothetical protein COA79_16320 [Planctomycetota bacterium]|nr:MAG: hypothetical protein COA79_16320 [Planctomycetota bacterium]